MPSSASQCHAIPTRLMRETRGGGGGGGGVGESGVGRYSQTTRLFDDRYPQESHSKVSAAASRPLEVCKDAGSRAIRIIEDKQELSRGAKTGCAI